MKKGLPVGGIVLLIVGVFFGFIAIKMQFFDAPLQESIAEDIIFVGEEGVLPENDGKIIIVNGRLDLLTPVYDDNLGVTIQSPAASRNSLIYKKPSIMDNEKRLDEEEWNSGPSEEYLGQVMIGDFTLSGDLTRVLPKEAVYSDYNHRELEDAGLYLKEDSSWTQKYFLEERPRDIRYYYGYFDMDKHDLMTIIGRQDGDKLELVADLKAHSVMDGKLDKEGLVKYMTKANNTAGIFYLILTLVFLALAIWRINKWRKA